MYEIGEEARWRRHGRIAVAVLLAVALVCFYHWMYTAVFGWELPKTALMRKSLLRSEARLKLLDRQLDFYDVTLSGIEERDDRVYRSIFGLDSVAQVPVPDDMQDLSAKADSLARRVILRSAFLAKSAVLPKPREIWRCTCPQCHPFALRKAPTGCPADSGTESTRSMEEENTIRGRISPPGKAIPCMPPEEA